MQEADEESQIVNGAEVGKGSKRIVVLAPKTIKDGVLFLGRRLVKDAILEPPRFYDKVREAPFEKPEDGGTIFLRRENRGLETRVKIVVCVFLIAKLYQALLVNRADVEFERHARRAQRWTDTDGHRHRPRQTH